MSLVRDIGTRLAQSFVSLDDLVFGRQATTEGLGQAERLGRSAAGALAITSNLATRGLSFGAQLGAKTAATTAGVFEGWVPGAGLARQVAKSLERASASSAEEASLLGSWAVELAEGDDVPPSNPLTGEPWLDKRPPEGYSWGELAADSLITPWLRVANLPIAVGGETLSHLSTTFSSSDGGEKMMDWAWDSLDSMLGATTSNGDGEEEKGELDLGELREQLLLIATASSIPTARSLGAFAEGGPRAFLGDGRKLHRAMCDALEEMRSVASSGEEDELLLGFRVNALLRERARSIVDHFPNAFVEALGARPLSPSQVLSALLGDLDNLRVFSTDYPQAVALMGAQAVASLTLGVADGDRLDAYYRGETEGNERPLSARLLEAAGAESAAASGKEHGGEERCEEALRKATISVARDVYFLYGSRVLSRKKALDRAAELFGEEERTVLAGDPSLRSELLDADRQERQRLLRDAIAEREGSDLREQIELCRQQERALAGFSDGLMGFSSRLVATRRSILQSYLGLADQTLALRGAPTVGPGERKLTSLRSWARKAS